MKKNTKEKKLLTNLPINSEDEDDYNQLWSKYLKDKKFLGSATVDSKAAHVHGHEIKS